MKESTSIVNSSVLNEIETLIWDWNGTLLDDVGVNLKTINRMLSKRGLKELDLSMYKLLFCFPVKLFYKEIGFNLEKESIEEISVDYHTTYKSYEDEICLNSDVPFVLDTIRQTGINQYILSACMKDDLMANIQRFNLTDKFQAIYGAEDICASGKIGLGKLLIKNHSLNPDKTLIIGDTLHDAEVARSLGINHLFYSGGHNSNDLLIKEGRVVTSLKEILF